MSITDERRFIEKRLLDNLSANIYVQFDNVLGLVENGGTTVATEQGLDQWIRMTILTNDSNQAELGSTFTRQNGLISCQVFVKSGTGSNGARVLLNTLKTLFHIKQFDGITTRAGQITNVGETAGSGDEDNFYQMNIDFPYFRHES